MFVTEKNENDKIMIEYDVDLYESIFAVHRFVISERIFDAVVNLYRDYFAMIEFVFSQPVT